MSQTPNQIRRTMERQTEIQMQPEAVHLEARPVQMEMAPVMEEETDQQEVELNTQLMAAVQQQLPAVDAQQTAPGAPVQVEPSAKMSFKAKQREKRHAKAAKKACPVGTAATYDMVKQLKTMDVGKENAIRDYGALAEQQKVDKRVLKVFSIPYQVNKKGQPATPEDQQAKGAADAFVQDYCSKDIQRRKPHLDRMVDDLLSVQYAPNMFSQWNLRKDAARLKEIGDKMVYMENVMKDPVNKPYFEHMDPLRKEKLKAAFDTIYNPFVGAMTMVYQKNGVDFNSGDYYGYGSMPAIQMGQEMAGQMEQDFLAAIPVYQQKTEEIQQAFDQKVSAAAEDYAARLRKGNESLEQIKQDPRLQLEENEETSQFLTRSVMLLKPGEEHHEENLKTVQLMLETGRLKGEAPSRDLYHRLKEALAPRVQKVLDCDVDALAGLSDNALMLQLPTLNELFMDNMFVADLMKTKHYTAQPDDEMPFTMKDDLVGMCLEEYSYKASMLRALSERARALALDHEQKQGTIGQTCFTSKEWRAASQDIPAWIESRKSMASALEKSSKEKLKKAYTPGTEEYQNMITRKTFLKNQKCSLADDPLAQVGEEYRLGQSDHIKAVRKRLREERYHSLAHTKEEVEERGLPQDIGEPLFRSFDSFLATRAAQELLTTEQFRQLLEDTGASEAEMPREEAIQKNARGLAQYKRVISAQFEMFERKYGSLFDLDMEQMLEHQQELMMDFVDLQVPLNMVTKYPDFIDPNQPEDVMLQHRVEYYGVAGKAICDFFAFLASADSMETARNLLEEGKKYGVQMEGYAASLAAMQEHHPGFRHPVDWSQGIRNPDAPPEG